MTTDRILLVITATAGAVTTTGTALFKEWEKIEVARALAQACEATAERLLQ